MSEKEPLKIRVGGRYIDGNGNLVMMDIHPLSSKNTGVDLFIGSNKKIYTADGKLYTVSGPSTEKRDHLFDQIGSWD